MSDIPGFIQWTRSVRGTVKFPVLVFSADVDFVTAGMVSLTSMKRAEVVATMATGEEWNRDDLDAVEARVNAALGRADLRCPRLLRKPDGRVAYADLRGGGGDALPAHTQTPAEFVAAGGVVTKHAFDV